MREKLSSLPVVQLREIAKANGIKSVTIMRKQQLIDRIIEVNEKKEQETLEKEAAKKAETLVKSTSDEEKKPVGREHSSRRSKSGEVKKSREHRSSKEHRKVKSKNIEENNRETKITKEVREQKNELPQEDNDTKTGILEVLSEGYGFIRCDNYLPGEADAYVAPSQIKKFRLKTGDMITGKVRDKKENEKFGALYYLEKINGEPLENSINRPNFETLTPVFPNERIHLETDGHSIAMRIVDIVSPIGKGQRGMIVSPPKAGKTTLLKETAKAIQQNNPEMHMIILLIDERPEEVTDIKEAIQGENVEVIYSTFDELPDHHKRVSEMVIERAKRLVEHGRDVIILLDSITRLARAYNMTVPPSGRTLSGGLDPAALHMPKRFFGAARNMREGGSLTILATALVDTGSKMDDVVYEEFKGTGNMELVLDRKLSEKRIFPAIDITKSGTRREDLLLDSDELGASYIIRKETNGMRKEDAVEQILNLFARTSDNKEFVQKIGRLKITYTNNNGGGYNNNHNNRDNYNNR